MPTLGASFGDELIAAGLGGLPLSWMMGADSATIDGRANLTPAQNTTLDAVIAVHNPATLPARTVREKTFVADTDRAALIDKLKNANLAAIESYVRGVINADGAVDLASSRACLKRIESAFVVLAKAVALSIVK